MTAPTWVPFSPTAQSVRISASKGQRGRRRVVVVTDQHTHPLYPEGRAWWGYAEKQSSEDAIAPGLVGDLYPIATDSHVRLRPNQPPKFFKGWQAPWYPPSKYINTGLDLTDGPHLTIAYKVMDVDFTQSRRDYLRRAVEAAVQHQLPIPDDGTPVDFRVQAIVGRAPMSPRIPKAALTGHQWLLGFTGPEDEDETLARLLDPTVDLLAIQKAAREMEAQGAKVNYEAIKEVETLRAQMAQMQSQMLEMTRVFQEQMQEGADVAVQTVPTGTKRRGRPPKVQPETADASA